MENTVTVIGHVIAKNSTTAVLVDADLYSYLLERVNNVHVNRKETMRYILENAMNHADNVQLPTEKTNTVWINETVKSLTKEAKVVGLLQEDLKEQLAEFYEALTDNECSLKEAEDYSDMH